MTMSQQRYNELDANGGTLTPAEQAEGWHFCPEFDGLLTMGEGPGPCPCGIHGDSPLQLTRDPEPHGTRDTFVPPPKLNKFGGPIKTFEEQLADLKSRIADIEADPLELVVHDPNAPVPQMTDEEVTAHLAEGIKCKAEADAMDDNMMSFQEEERAMIAKARAFIAKDDARDILIREMQEAIDSITEEDMKPIDRPVPPIPSPEDKTVHYHNKRWWFWDETGMHRHGPYETHAECMKDLNHYCNVYLGHPEDPS